jgi:hypothetical protein
LLRFFLLWALVVPAAAQVYKWVDESGTTHYGERPPQDMKAKAVEQHMADPGPAAGKAAQPGWKEQDLEFRKRRIQAGQMEEKNRQQEQSRREACTRTRYALARLNSAPRVYSLDEKGERVFQSDEERNASAARLEQQIAERCR